MGGLPRSIPDLLDIHAVHRAIQDLDEDAIVRVASVAATSERGGWFARARAIGELQKRARYKDAAVVKYAKLLGIGKTLAFELGTIDRHILLPRLGEDGDAATFPIAERRFYSLACRLAPSLKRSALEVLAVAEQGRKQHGRFTTRQLREHFGVPRATDPAKSLKRCLSALGTLDQKTRQRFARAVQDPAEAIQLAQQTAKNARLLVEDLRARTEGNR